MCTLSISAFCSKHADFRLMFKACCVISAFLFCCFGSSQTSSFLECTYSVYLLLYLMSCMHAIDCRIPVASVLRARALTAAALAHLSVHTPAQTLACRWTAMRRNAPHMTLAWQISPMTSVPRYSVPPISVIGKPVLFSGNIIFDDFSPTRTCVPSSAYCSSASVIFL